MELDVRTMRMLARLEDERQARGAFGQSEDWRISTDANHQPAILETDCDI